MEDLNENNNNKIVRKTKLQLNGTRKSENPIADTIVYKYACMYLCMNVHM